LAIGQGLQLSLNFCDYISGRLSCNLPSRSEIHN